MPAAKPSKPRKAAKAPKASKPSARPAGRKAPAKAPALKRTGAAVSESHLLDERIKELGGWRGETLAAVRRLIRQADPHIVEEMKWRKASNPGGVPVWSHDGMVCTGETYKDHVKLTFLRGAQLKDPKRVFNGGFAGARRVIDLREGDAVDEAAFKELVRAAVALNQS